MVTRAVFLDRDGVINANVERDGKPVAPTAMKDFRILPGAEEAVAALKSAGFLIVIVTNQPDIGTGRTPLAELEAMHAEVRRRMPVDAIKACFHVDADNCMCRKPKPGMITTAAAELDIDLVDSYLVGDRWRDVEAGRAAGCKTFFVDYGHIQDGPLRPDWTVRSLAEAARIILDNERSMQPHAARLSR
ncbi:MAG: HAD family hydrolase [Proteobacteria bacterium]|nr:HAD family hydrolase [Pseudomonadota bacterium]